MTGRVLVAVAGLGLAASCLGCAGDDARRRRMERDARYAAAERAFSARAHADAERLFLEVAADAATTGDPATRALSAYRRGQIREREGRFDEALALYREAEAHQGTERAAFAAWRQAKLIIEGQGRLVEGRAALKRVIDTYPRYSAADKAAKYLGIRRQPAELDDRGNDVEVVRWMRDAADRHRETTVGDNLLFFAAWAQVFRLGDLGGARETLRTLADRYHVTPLLDDALFLLAAIERRQGRVDEAIAVYEALLRLRVDQDYLVGDFRAKRLDDAALAVGLVHLHLRRDAPAAVTAFRRVIDEFPTSVFRDDAYWGLAGAQDFAGDAAGSRETLRALLGERPDSRYARRARDVLDGRASLPPPDASLARTSLAHPQGKGEL